MPGSAVSGSIAAKHELLVLSGRESYFCVLFVLGNKERFPFVSNKKRNQFSRFVLAHISCSGMQTVWSLIKSVTGFIMINLAIKGRFQLALQYIAKGWYGMPVRIRNLARSKIDNNYFYLLLFKA